MDDSSGKGIFISAAIIKSFLFICLFKQVIMVLITFLDLLDPSFLTGMSPAAWL
jgi:hypothetical protein